MLQIGVPASACLEPVLRDSNLSGRNSIERNVSPHLAFSETRHDPLVRLPLHRHDAAYLSVVIEGAYVESVGSREWRCAANTVRLHPAGEQHADRFGPTGARVLNVELSPDWLEGMSRPKPLEGAAISDCDWIGPVLLHGANDEHLDELVVLLLQACEREASFDFARTKLRWLHRAFDYIEGHLHQRCTLSDVAAAADVHPAHMARTFRQRLRMTLGEYVRHRRVARAQNMLSQHPEQSVAHVAFACGFADHAHLTRTFKSLTGETPRGFRGLAGPRAASAVHRDAVKRSSGSGRKGTNLLSG